MRSIPRRGCILYLFLFIFFYYHPDVTADQGLTTGSNLTLQDCLRIARQKNPSFLSYKESLKASEEKESGALRGMLPSMTLYYSGKKAESSSDNYNISASVRQPLLKGRSLVTQWKMAGLNKEIAALELRRQRQLLVLSVKQAWYGLLKAGELLTEAKDALERLRQHERNAKHFFKEGMIWRTDVLEASVRVARGEQDLIVAENDLSRAEGKLNVLLHREVTDPLDIEGSLEWIFYEMTYEKAKETALKSRPDLLQTYIDHNHNKASVTLARSGYWPDVSLEAKWSQWADKISMEDPAEDKSIQVTAAWNVWAWGKTGKDVSAARAQVRRGNLQIAQLKDQVALEVQDAWLSVQETAKKVEVLKKALEQGEENYRVNMIRYSERLGTAKNVLDAQDLLTSTKKDYISAIASYLVSLAGLDYAIGVEN